MSKTAVWWRRLVVCGLIFSILTCLLVLKPKEQKVVLTFGMFAGNQWDVPDDDCYRIIDETIEEFEKKYPNVTIRYDSGILKDDYSEWLSQKAIDGELPDVFMVLSEDFNTFSSVGVLKNLDSLIAKDPSFHEEDYYQGSYREGECEGSQYALPYESVPTLMFVNKTLLEKENIAMPKEDWTWEDFYEICKKVTKDTDGNGKVDQYGVYGYKWKNALYSNGASLFNKAGTKCNLTGEEVEESILFTKKINELSGFSNPTSNDFDTGKVAFQPMKFSEFRTYKPYPWKINKYFEFEWDCIKLPTGPSGESKSDVDNLLIGINNRSKNSQMAWKFLKELTYNRDTQEKLFRYSQGISPLKDVTNSKKAEKILDEYMGEDTIVKVELLNEVMEQAEEKPKFREYDTIMGYIDNEILKLMMLEEGFDENIQKIKNDIDNMLKK